MILRATQLLNSEPSILAKERQEARFTLIDEFQDSNIAQIQLAQLLAGPEQNIFAVGDPDQAIYRFRGASSAAFDEFIARFPKTKSVVLDRNLRSTSAILNCAHAVIAHNPAVTSRLGRPGQRFDRQSLISERELRAKADAKPLQTHPVDLVMPSGNSEEESCLSSNGQKGNLAERSPQVWLCSIVLTQIATLWLRSSRRGKSPFGLKA